MEGIIYSYKSPSGRYYIGQTIDENARIKGHKSSTIKTKTKFGNALRKYGFDNFEYSVLIRMTSFSKEYLREWLNFFEVMYIEKYDSYHSGYNSNRGGDGRSAISVIKPVIQYSLEGEFIQEWESAQEANRELGIARNKITCNCKLTYKNKTAGGFMWRYKGDPPPEYRRKVVVVSQYDLNDNFIRSYSSLREASIKTGISLSMIIKNTKRESLSTHGFVFTKEEKNAPVIKFKESPKKSNRKSVCVYDKSGILITEYDSIKAAADAFNAKEKMISGVCNGRRKSYKGFIFKFK